VFVSGTCFCPTGRIRELAIVVDGDLQPVIAHGMPRLDFYGELHPTLDAYALDGLDRDPESADDPELRSYCSGFWGIARIRSGDGRDRVELAVRARLAGGGEVVAPLASIELARPDPPTPAGAWSDDTGEQRVAICMATHEPPDDLLSRQLESIRAQTHRNWLCMISDDSSSPERFAALQKAVAGDPRFVVSRSPGRLGFYRNFERALALAPAGAEYVALADQDDRWHPDKLERLIAELGSARLVYSDARIVDRDGAVVADTYWGTRTNNHSDLLSLLVANAVTGAASLFPRRLLDYALPFPPAQFAHYHDHWLGLTALSLGEIRFVDRPLYDYVQHPGASLGHEQATTMTPLSQRLRRQRSPRERARMWRLHYFVDACRLLVFATVLQMRCGAEMPRRKRRALDRFLATDGSVSSLALLGARGARELSGRRRETLGAEWMLFWAFVWRRLLAVTARERPQRRLRLDAVPPPSLVMALERTREASAAGSVAAKIAPLDLAPSEAAPARINMLIPTIDLRHFFGGYIAKFNLAARLAERGLRVRIVTVDPASPLPPSWRREVESYEGLDGVFDRVEVAFGRNGSPLEVSSSDRFIATTWWTGHIAAEAARRLGGGRFLYLIQEYEPFTFPMGTHAALAEQSYGFEHFALFSTELLREYFREHRIGVYAAGVPAGDEASAAFENAITDVAPPTARELSQRRTRRLLVYARPEPHAARNMFELAVLGLSRAVQLGAFRGGWELNGIGSVQARTRVELPGAAGLNVLPRADQDSYARSLRDHDVGLALMYTPHPSLVPIEMASAGMLTVTNTFANKTAEAMTAISPNLIAVEPSIDAVADGLCRAADAVGHFERRVRGSEVQWSRDWDQSFPDSLLELLEHALELRR
jgi:GT2 family glycosyltransferase